MSKEPTLNDIRKEVARLDPNLSPKDDAFRVAMLLLAGLVVGADEKRLAEFTGFDVEWVDEISRRLRHNRIWRGVKTDGGEWSDPETGGVAFWMAVGCGLGLVERA